MQLLLLLATLLAPTEVGAETQYRRDLSALAEKCDELNLSEQATITRNWDVEQRADQLHLYLPENQSSLIPDDAPQLVKFWHERWMQIRGEYANHLFAQAKLISEEDPVAAYQLLYRAVRENPEHKQALAVLGLENIAGATVTKPGVIHSRTAWPARSYWRLESQHFVIDTNKSREVAERIAAELHILESTWKQVFFSYWADPAALVTRFNGDDAALSRHTAAKGKHRIIVFESRNQYASFLASKGSNATASLGLYDDNSQTSYFFIDEVDTRDTWLHEVTHQLFQERGPGIRNIGRSQNTMLVEGIAMYMESLQIAAGHVTLGGWESNRLQFARYNRLNGQFHIPAEQLLSLGLKDVQDHQRQGDVYYLAAGLVHSLMNSDEENANEIRASLIGVVDGIYHGKDMASDLSSSVMPWEDLEKSYVQFLIVSNGDISNLDSNVSLRNVVLSQSPINDESLKIISQFRDIKWLDLTYTKVTDEGVLNLKTLTNIQQISFEGTGVTDDSAGILDSFENLIELDFSNTAISDKAVLHIASKTKLEVLYLTGTKISNEGLNKLSSLRNLEVLDVRKTNASDAAVEQLKQKLPKLR